MTVDSLLAHIVSQTRGNLEILVAQNQLADSDCRSLLEKLKSIEDVSKIAERTQNIALAQTATTPTHTTPDSRTSNPLPTPEPTSVLFRARAIWPYNEHGRVSFSSLPLGSLGAPMLKLLEGITRPFFLSRRHHRSLPRDKRRLVGR